MLTVLFAIKSEYRGFCKIWAIALALAGSDMDELPKQNEEIRNKK